MSYTIKVTNSSSRVIETQYRMLGSQVPLKIAIQPRALLNELNFYSKEHYDAWKSQNMVFFNRGILFENEKRENLLKDSIQNDAKNIAGKMQAKTDLKTEDLKAAADNVNASINLETENLTEKKKIRK